MWQYDGRQRPPFAEEPGPGQESVWDYPRPPLLEHCAREVRVLAGDIELARAGECLRVLETASPPTYYLPESAIDWSRLLPAAGTSVCEWKGAASYWALSTAPEGEAVAWSYPQATATFAAIRGALAFYPGRVACFLDGERVRPQPGYFYGGWITDEISGPWKGAQGTGHW